MSHVAEKIYLAWICVRQFTSPDLPSPSGAFKGNHHAIYHRVRTHHFMVTRLSHLLYHWRLHSYLARRRGYHDPAAPHQRPKTVLSGYFFKAAG
jgi:hypothetical protein